jgi:ribosomal protein S18 acetylase RimI-like enzyme
MECEIRRLQPDDWAVLRDIRLTALADTPQAFASTLDAEAAYDEPRWRGWIAACAFFLAWDGGRPVGIVGGFGQQDGGWHIISMWVSPQARGAGVAGRLIDAVARHARAENAPALTQWVTDGNDRARAFYQRAGFRGTGRRQPVRPQAPELREEEMILFLRLPDRHARNGWGVIKLLRTCTLLTSTMRAGRERTAWTRFCVTWRGFAVTGAGCRICWSSCSGWLRSEARAPLPAARYGRRSGRTGCPRPSG